VVCTCLLIRFLDAGGGTVIWMMLCTVIIGLIIVKYGKGCLYAQLFRLDVRTSTCLTLCKTLVMILL